MITIQVVLLVTQQHYGVTAILPHFIFKIFNQAEFKYFTAEPEADDHECSICKVSLRQLSPETLLETDQIFNNVIETYCGHKFHLRCLKRRMEVNSKCPQCLSIIPPIEEDI